MSQDKRLSPLQPPVNNAYASSMAQVQRLPSLPTLSNFTGYVDARSAPDRGPPAFPAPPAQPHIPKAGQLPPIQLPPLNPSNRPANDPLAISNLLSRNPESPGRRKHPQPPLSFPSSRLPSNSPASSFSESPNQPASRMPTHPPPPRHFLDQPPSHPRPPTTQPGPPHFFQRSPGQPAWHFPHNHVEPGLLRDKHPSSENIFPKSHHSGSSSASPITTAPTPSIPTPIGPPPVDYTLSIRQQPSAARACGFGERDRRVVDPPPILELKITDKTTGQPALDSGCILALHCTLLGHDGADETEVPPTQDGMTSTRRLMGTIVASPYQAKDEHGVAGTFFVFPDLSCRSPGRYRLRFKLLRVDLGTMKPGGVSPSVAAIVSEVFSVYTAKDFPGMRASSALLKALRRQGLNVGVKKGSEARKGKGKAVRKEESSEDEEEEDEEEGTTEERQGSEGSGVEGSVSSGEVSPKTTTRKKGKRRKMGARSG